MRLAGTTLGRLRWLAALGLLLAAGVADAREYHESRRVQRLPPEEVLQNLIEGSGPIVVDARAAPLYARGHIPGAMNIHSKVVWGWVPDLEKYRDRGILFYCDNGLNSKRAAKKLLGEGFRKVYIMEGYLRRWKALGYPMEYPEPK